MPTPNLDGKGFVGSNNQVAATNAFAENMPNENENIVQRLDRRIQEVRQLGFNIRREILDGQQASWCVIAGQKVVFLDLSHTAREQLAQLNEVIQSYQTELAISESPSEGSRSRPRHSKQAA